MRLWLNKSGEVSLREQLVTQVILSILGREMPPGHRLPSTRELARRFGIHANTASAAYRELEREGWLEFRHGSGVFVRSGRPTAAPSSELAIDQLIGDLAAKARRLGAPESLLRARLRRWLSFEPPAHWLLIEPDPELGRIVRFEMEQELGLPVTTCTPAECLAPELLERAIPAVLPSKADTVRRLLPAGIGLTVLQIHPVSPELDARLKRYLPEHSTDLIGIASRWVNFQRIGYTLLIAAGISPQCLLVRDAGRPGWKRGLEATSGVVCDAATAAELPKGCFPLVYRLLGEQSMAQLRQIESTVGNANSDSPDSIRHREDKFLTVARRNGSGGSKNCAQSWH
jgi:GntR family transcriptional regulator